MDEAKIRLSAKEMELVTNAGWILTKNDIMQKAKWRLEQLQQQMTDHVQQLPQPLTIDISKVSPKISKGENYKGLPYLVLDYPRIFEKENVFAIRTMFWWGNFFSITLHLGGIYKEAFEEKIIAATDIFKSNDFAWCINTDEWEHHFETSNYIPLTTYTANEFKTLVEKNSFIKKARQYPLQQWNDIPENLISDFKLILRILGT